eukprot:scaffold16235_cov50-Phaeocystis_antarctica.AAC.5
MSQLSGGGGGEGGSGRPEMHSADPLPLYLHVTVSPAAGSDVGVPPLASVLPAGKVHPPPPQQVESADEEMTQSTLVSSVWPVTMKLKLPGEYPSGRVGKSQ